MSPYSTTLISSVQRKSDIIQIQIMASKLEPEIIEQRENL